MGTDDRRLADEWLEVAKQDLSMAQLALEADPPLLYPALFHAQQAAEKALKAVLVADGVIYPRTHDLVALWGLASKSVKWGEPPTDLLLLTEYAVRVRYPLPEDEYVIEDGRRAVEDARTIVDLVEETL